MAFSSGTFSRLYNWVTDKNNFVKITASRMDAEFDGIATGLSTCITRDGQSTITAAIPFNGQKITGLGDATAATDALNRQTADTRYATQSYVLIGNDATLTNDRALAVGAGLSLTDAGAGSTVTLGRAALTGDVTASANGNATTIATNAVTLAKLAAAVQSALCPAGSIVAYGGTAAPTDWLLCYGQAVSRTTYAALFTAISTTYGVGDGSTTFNLPDLRGRVLAGQDDMGGSSANRLTGLSGGIDGDVLGGTGGAESVTLAIAEMPLHGHPWMASAQSGNISFSATAGGWPMAPNNNASQAAYTGAVSTTLGQQLGGTGGGGAHNNVQPTIIVNYIIKT